MSRIRTLLAVCAAALALLVIPVLPAQAQVGAPDPADFSDPATTTTSYVTAATSGPSSGMQVWAVIGIVLASVLVGAAVTELVHMARRHGHSHAPAAA
jgi:predicted cobalt transporter CbtA